MKAATASLDSVPGIGERFEIRRHLGAGGFGTVYEAFDRETRKLVALKVLRNAQPQALYRFKQEFRSLADLRHPNLVTLHELVCVDDHWLFTMDLVDGTTFLKYVRPGATSQPSGRDGSRPIDSDPSARHVDPSVSSPVSAESDERPRPSGAASLDENRLRAALLQLVEGLEALHANGKLHCDVKPPNVLVSLRGRVTILDFGLIRELDSSESNVSVESTVVGTPAYASPEQIAGFGLSPASDWYSVGVMLFEALTGSRPHQGTVLEIIRAKQIVEPRRPSELDPSVPADLSDMAFELLRRIPEERPTGRQLRKRLLASRASLPPPAAPPRPGRLLVGRNTQVEQMLRAYDAVLADGRPVALHLRGASGLGKTALLARFVEALEAKPGAPTVLSGRCYEQESVPYKGLDSLVDALARALSHRDREETAALMPFDAAVLGRAFPVLQRVRAVADSPWIAGAGDSQELRRRAFAALRELFCRMAFRRPLVLAIDDLQWGDVDSAAFLLELLGPPLPPPILLIASYRDEDLDSNPALSTLRAVAPGRDPGQDILVGPLGAAESVELALALLGRTDEPAVRDATLVAREADGSPFFVAAMVGHLRQLPATARGAASIRLESVLVERISQLEPATRGVLECVAAAGVPRPIAVVRAACANDAGTHDAIATLRAASLVRTGGMRARDAIEIFHDRIRQAVLGMMDDARRCEVHRALAMALEDTGQADPDSLLFHFRAAGDLARARVYAVSAADRAADSLAFSRAAELYRVALDLDADADRLALSVKLADALANQGKAPDAALVYRDAAAIAPFSQTARLQQKAAAELLKCGHVDSGVELMSQVARDAGFYYPRSQWMAWLSAGLSRARLFLRGFRFKLTDLDAIAPRDLRRVDLCWSLGATLSNVDPVRSLDFQTRGLLLALRLGEPERLARALMLEAGFVSLPGARAQRTVQRTIDLARSIALHHPGPYFQGLVRLVEGISAYLFGNWRAAFDACEESASLLSACPGAAFELTTARHYAVWSLFYLGRFKDMSSRARGRLRAALDDGDLYSATGMSTANSNLAWLLAGDVADARAKANTAIGTWSRSGFHVQHFFHLYALVQADLYEGRSLEAWQRVHAHWRQFAGSLLRISQHLRVEAVQLRARCALARARDEQGASRDEMIQQVLRDARRLADERGPYSPGYDALLRAAVSSLRGDAAAAAALLRRAIEAFESADMALHAEAARWRLGALLQGEEGRQLQDSAASYMRAQEITDPARTAGLLAPGFDP